MTEPVLFVTLEQNGKTLTAEEFLALAEQNGAIITPKEAEKSRRDTTEWFSRHQFYTGIFGDWHIIDTHAWDYKIYRFIANCFQFCFGLFLLLLAFLLICALL